VSSILLLFSLKLVFTGVEASACLDWIQWAGAWDWCVSPVLCVSRALREPVQLAGSWHTGSRSEPRHQRNVDFNGKTNTHR